MLDSSLDKLAEYAIRAMIYEVSITPKPGLVDRCNCGAHSDMNFFTFIDSSVVVGSYLKKMTVASNRCDIELNVLLQSVRQIGLDAEEAMFQVTGGVNTQKGLIFLLGCVCSVCGWMLAHGDVINARGIASNLRKMLQGICETELNTKDASALRTAGAMIYAQSGIRGVRGEAESGLPSVLEIALPTLRKLLGEGVPFEAAALQALLALMTSVDDTTVINRGGLKALEYMKNQAETYLETGGVKADEGYILLKDIDFQFICRGISPGGCSDLLAVTLFIYFVEADEMLQ